METQIEGTPHLKLYLCFRIWRFERTWLVSTLPATYWAGPAFYGEKPRPEPTLKEAQMMTDFEDTPEWKVLKRYWDWMGSNLEAGALYAPLVESERAKGRLEGFNTARSVLKQIAMFNTQNITLQDKQESFLSTAESEFIKNMQRMN